MRCSHYSPEEGHCKKKFQPNDEWYPSGLCRTHWLKSKGINPNVIRDTRYKLQEKCQECGTVLLVPKYASIGYCGNNCRQKIYNRKAAVKRYYKRIITRMSFSLGVLLQ